MEMDQNDALLEGPPPPEQAPDLEFFPALITPTQAELPAGAKSYVRSIFLTSLSPACPFGPALVILEVQLFNCSKEVRLSILSLRAED